MARAKQLGWQPAREALRRAGFTMAGVAVRLSLTENQVGQPLRGVVAPSPELVAGLCRLPDAEPDEVLRVVAPHGSLKAPEKLGQRTVPPISRSAV